MGEWKEYRLDEVAEITSSKRIFYSEYVSEGIPFYRSKEIIDLYNNRNISTELFISENRYNEIKLKYGVPQKDDILLTSVGSLGIPYLVKNTDKFYFKDGNLTWIRNINKNIILPQYLILWICSNIGKQKLDEVTIGSTQPALTISGLKTIEIVLPSIEEQKRITSVISFLDDKIDLFHRENKTLEAMAETLFRQWFIEEVRQDVLLGDVIETTSGGTPSRKNEKYYQNGTIDWVKSKELNRSFLLKTEEKITLEAVKNSSAKFLPANSVLIAMYGATVGEYAIIAKEMTCNQAVCALKPNDNYPYTYLYLWAKFMQDDFLNLACGAAQQNISQVLIKQQQVCSDVDTVKQFHSIVEPLFEKLKQNEIQLSSLEEMKNVILHKLINNELNINEL